VRPLAWAVGLTVLGSLGGVLVASALLIFNNSLRDRLVPWLISYTVGTLLGVALLDLLSEAPARLPAGTVHGPLLAGIMLFFAMSDLIPDPHRDRVDAPTFKQLLHALAGIGPVVVVSSLIGEN
jgi:zinc transporter ZupT